MAGKMSPAAQQNVAKLEAFHSRVMHLHSLIEQFATTKTNPENLKAAIKRASDHLKLSFMTAGFESMAQICGAIHQASSRSGNQGAMARTLREHMGNLKFQVELSIRTIMREDQELQMKRKALKEAERAAGKAGPAAEDDDEE